jgi:hypothetical protein
LKEILEGLKSSSAIYEEIQLPSKGRLYNGQNGPVKWHSISETNDRRRKNKFLPLLVSFVKVKQLT